MANITYVSQYRGDVYGAGNWVTLKSGCVDKIVTPKAGDRIVGGVMQVWKLRKFLPNGIGAWDNGMVYGSAKAIEVKS